MSDTTRPPVATLAGVTLPGDNRPVSESAMPDHLSVLRPIAGGGWRRVPPAPGMPIQRGDVIHLRSDAFKALGARAFTVDDGVLSAGGQAPPDQVKLHAHEATHVVQQRSPRVTPINEAEAESIERQAEKVEEMVLHGAGITR